MDKIFAEGIFFNLPSANAPEWVLGRLSFKVDQAKAFLEAHENKAGYCNIDLLTSKAGKPYAALNTYEVEKPDSLKAEPAIEYPTEDINPDDVPF